MLQINRHILDNGLRLVHAQDTSTQMVALNILYNVGARDENPEHTGFAHLFEHLMFGGSVNIPDYDAPLQLAGGENGWNVRYLRYPTRYQKHNNRYPRGHTYGTP